MASVLEPAVQFAQRLASNEKPVRTKAMKKLRKYISVRSQKAADGFTPDELLKLWKGLFYCLWMQDKPLLQEQLSNQISSLIHSFQDVDGQLLYLQSFLQTFKREWNGIDRLRMDKFFQLVRFMFRQTFQMLKKTDWDSRFLELLWAQLLQGGSEAPCGLRLHVLDLYLSELAGVAADELSADQNLVFIGPFCKAAAKTKDRTLLSAIRTSIFGTIIEQAPFAIEDLMKELEAAADSDSGQASEEESGSTDKREQRGGGAGKEAQMNGSKSEDDEDKPQDTDSAAEEDVGPVLQFDYGALAAKLFELASRNNTSSHNRRQLYGVVKALRNLSEGIFPSHEVSEEVSTDEDDDMFCSRKWMKRRRRLNAEEEPPATKKKKKERCSSSPAEEKSDDAAASPQKKKRKRKKKRAAVGENSAEKTTEEEPSRGLGGENAAELQDRTNVSAEKKAEDVELSGANAPGKKRKRKRREKRRRAAAPGQEDTAGTHATTPTKKTKIQQEIPQGEGEDGISMVTAGKEEEELLAVEVAGEDEATVPPQAQSKGSPSKQKKKKKIPVVFEFEADELQDVASGDAEETPAPVEAVSPKKTQKKKTKSQSDFVAFQTSAAAPAPLFCRTRGGASRKPQTPKLESKKVTFGLKNNKTAEFRKSDRSLLLSPEGSSRLAFDPQQKPKVGVLKSTPLAARGANVKRRGTPGRAAKARPTAADFF